MSSKFFAVIRGAITKRKNPAAAAPPSKGERRIHIFKGRERF
jgi:hypothetical protein